MSLIYNNKRVNNVVYNNKRVNSIIYNGKRTWTAFEYPTDYAVNITVSKWENASITFKVEWEYVPKNDKRYEILIAGETDSKTVSSLGPTITEVSLSITAGETSQNINVKKYPMDFRDFKLLGALLFEKKDMANTLLSLNFDAVPNATKKETASYPYDISLINNYPVPMDPNDEWYGKSTGMLVLGWLKDPIPEPVIESLLNTPIIANNFNGIGDIRPANLRVGPEDQFLLPPIKETQFPFRYDTDISGNRQLFYLTKKTGTFTFSTTVCENTDNVTEQKTFSMDMTKVPSIDEAHFPDPYYIEIPFNFSVNVYPTIKGCGITDIKDIKAIQVVIKTFEKNGLTYLRYFFRQLVDDLEADKPVLNATIKVDGTDKNISISMNKYNYVVSDTIEIASNFTGVTLSYTDLDGTIKTVTTGKWGYIEGYALSPYSKVQGE